MGEKATHPTPARQLCPNTDRPAWLLSGKHCALDHAMRATYGITCDDYHRLLAHQGGVCAVCGEPPGKWRLVVDHDHEPPYQVRGLAHHRCQRWITAAVVRYLAGPPARQLGLRVPEAKARRLEAKATAKRRRAAARRAQPKQAKIGQTAEASFADRVRAALEQTTDQGG